MKKKKNSGGHASRKTLQMSQKPKRGQEQLIYTGTKETERIAITAVSFDCDRFVNHEATEENLESLKGKFFGTTWINLDGVHKVELIEKVGKLFGLNRMVVEDVLNVTRRPRTDTYGDQTFVVCNLLTIPEGESAVKKEQVSFVLKENLLITFQEDKFDDFEVVRERIRKSSGAVRKLGADFLLYVLLDSVVDQYFNSLETIGEQIETIEDTLVTSPNTDRLSQIYGMKNEIILFRKYVWPMREVIARLERSEDSLIRDASRVYFRDLYDHIVEVMDMLDTFREMIYGMVDIYMSSASNRMNQIMKVLTIISTIFIPLTFIAGVYGMNFEYMPELKMKYGYPAVWAVMISTAVGIMLFVKRKRWV